MEIYCCRRPFESLATTAFRLLHRLLHDVMKKIIKGGDGYEAPLNGDQVEGNC
ncbi:hypothetical protein HanXRQr2_Chr06g0242421 [Helianthus annuus]|uniref:Uncharacterized protein n=1 Tax=Helianthus annuus TaxID=4232 RepID=A0A251VP86_HELAN|nr:hypothetical protein HanXRQr2_Chr06g0242421 [Helianthus annuus]KAJ0565239.1 hypothetical protein HanIR_Chr06g0260401 [Helianthus annuus]KAJ0572256.1 hypothetical protein HanHA89_Chr06g0213771 [Helianthus annuus]KAJ0739645.1 hypothetical protein HanOQP8_Chr06g0208011 [Helianthus annuus]